MNKSVYGLIFSLVIAFNTSSLICAEEEFLPLAEARGKPTPRHKRTLSQEQMGNLEELMKTGTGKRNARSRPSSRQYDSTEIKELLKEMGMRKVADSMFDETGNKREFHGGDFEKWKAGREKWLERQEERAAKKGYIEQLAGEDADEGDVNIALISAFNRNEPVLSFDEYLRDEREKAALRLLGKDLYNEISGDTDRLEK